MSDNMSSVSTISVTIGTNPEKSIPHKSTDFIRKCSDHNGMDRKTSSSEKSTIQKNEKIMLSPSKQSIKIWKNLITVSLGMMGFMSAYDMLRYVESSLNSEQGLGTATLAINYTMNIVCNLLLPTFIIRKIGSKWTLVLSIMLANFYFLAHFYPTFAVMIPGALFLGVGLGLVHPCSNSYVTHLAHSYAKLHDLPVENVINHFFGIFLFIQFMARIWGNLTNSLLLTPANLPANVNKTNQPQCGAQYCSENLKLSALLNGTSNNLTDILSDSPDSPTSSKAYTLYGAAIGTAVLAAVLVGALLDKPMDNEKEDEDKKKESVLHQTVATIRLMREPKLLLVITITFFMGLIESYMSSDYTKAFVTCSLGIHHVGFVTICYGVCASLFSYVWGLLAKYVGRIAIFVIATVIDICTIFAMLYWVPNKDEPVIFYVLSGLWGVADAVWRPQLYALYGYMFPERKEAAFGNVEVWQSAGLVVGYLWSDYLCLYVKLYIMLVVMAIGMMAYLGAEYIMWKSQRKSRTITPLSK